MDPTDRTDPDGPPDWRPASTDLAILRHLADGRTVEYIARRLDVSERTVRRRMRAVAQQLEVDSTIETVVRAVRRGLI